MSSDRTLMSSGRTQLRFLTCGSVDDGKSTLIGRLLYDTRRVPDDELRELERESRRHGRTNGDVDLSLLVDGLEAEREQAITIDVAYRFFATPRRSFIVADTPGHEQYTRNMVTGASACDAAVILLDARKGVLEQTCRHSYLCSLLGIRHVAVAVNKIDLVDFSQARFDDIVEAFTRFSSTLGFASVAPIPVSATSGDNVTSGSTRTPWHSGPTLLEWLETVDVPERARADAPLRFQVQWVNRPSQDFRGYAGTVLSGHLQPGDMVVVPRSGQSSRVARLVTADGDLTQASAGDAITVTLDDEIDVGRGDLLAHPVSRPECSDQFAAHVVWMSEEPMLPERGYLMRIGATYTSARVTALKHAVEVKRLHKVSAKTLQQNDIGLCNIATSQPVAFDPYAENRETGSFILIDRFSNDTVGAGVIQFGLRRARNIHWQNVTVDKAARAGLNHHRPAVIWFTGLSGAGKSTIANLVERELHAAGIHTYLLDGDNLRHGLNKDLGFTDAARVENIRRVGELAKLFVDAGLVVLCSFISPFEAERLAVRELVPDGEFIEVFVNAPLEECQRRDPKGLYARAAAGTLKNLTGLDSRYEPPAHPDIEIRTAELSADECARVVVDELTRRGLVPRM